MRIARKIEILVVATALILAATFLPAQTAKIHGRLTEDGSTMPGTNVVLKLDDRFVKGTVTDMQGKYEFGLLSEGSYTLEVKDASLTYRFAVTLAINETEPKDLELSQGLAYNEAGERVYKVGTTRIEEFAPGETREIFTLDPIPVDVVPRADLNRAAGGRGVEGAISMLGGGVYQNDAGGLLNISGSRDNGTAYYVDGNKIRGEFSVAQASINQVSLMNNGMPAEYGDATGGIIVISTYNPGMKAFPGKPLSRAEKQALRIQKKRGSSEGLSPAGGFHS